MSRSRKKQSTRESSTAGGAAQSAYSALVVCLLLLLATAIVFGQTVHHDFINYDDPDYVSQNEHVNKGLTRDGVAWAMTATCAHNWHPLTWLSHILDCQLYGLHAGGHHLTSVLLHIAAVIALFLVLWRMTDGLWPSAFVAAIFAIHPLRVESVAWIAERKDVLSGLFFMLTLAAYVGYVRHPFSLIRYLSVVGLFALGLMAKPMLVTLPFVLLLLDYWPLGRFSHIVARSANGVALPTDCGRRLQMPTEAVQDRQSPTGDALCSLDPRTHSRRLWLLLAEKAPLLLLTTISCVVTSVAQREAIMPTDVVPILVRVANALVVYVAYIRDFVLPVGLAVYYPHPGLGPPIWKVIVAGLVLTSVSAAVVMGRRKRPYLFVGWFWYVGMLVPVIGLIQVGDQAMADRYTYLPQIGLGIAVAWGAVELTRGWPHRRWVCGLASALIVAALLGCAWWQTTYWRDSVTLWDHAVECTEQNGTAHTNLGTALTDLGHFSDAVKHFEKATEIDPNSMEIRSNLGMALVRGGQINEAIKCYREALRISPDSVTIHLNLGSALLQSERLSDAISEFQLVLKLQPDSAKAHCGCAEVLVKRGKLDEAIDHLEKAVELKPDEAEAHANLGLLLANRDRLEEAIDHCRKALHLAEQQNNKVLAASVTAEIRLLKRHVRPKRIRP